MQCRHGSCTHSGRALRRCGDRRKDTTTPTAFLRAIPVNFVGGARQLSLSLCFPRTCLRQRARGDLGLAATTTNWSSSNLWRCWSKVVRLADTRPLADLIAHYVNRRLLNAIAREYRKGRLLLIGTTNLDAQRPWSGTWGRLRLALVPGLSALQKSHVSIRLDPCRICAGADRGQCCRQGL